MKRIGTRDFLRRFRDQTEPVLVMNHQRPVGTWYPWGTEPTGHDLLAEVPERAREVSIVERPRDLLDRG